MLGPWPRSALPPPLCDDLSVNKQALARQPGDVVWYQASAGLHVKQCERAPRRCQAASGRAVASAASSLTHARTHRGMLPSYGSFVGARRPLHGRALQSVSWVVKDLFSYGSVEAIVSSVVAHIRCIR